MARKHKHEEHQNHEAWAIPYGDLVTLLLAFFVVMYAVSSVNEGKYRVLSDSMASAFGGPPKSIKPIQLGAEQTKGAETESHADFSAIKIPGFGDIAPSAEHRPPDRQRDPTDGRDDLRQRQEAEFAEMTDAIQEAMRDLIDAALVTVRRTAQGLEIEINTDILFSSGVARLSTQADITLQRLAEILAPFPQRLRVEGHTDNLPIATAVFPSNWELSAARAASVVRLFSEHQIDPLRMTVVGYGEYHAVADNREAAGRNRNRRVVVVVLADPNAPMLEFDVFSRAAEPTSAEGEGIETTPPASVAVLPAEAGIATQEPHS